VQVHLVDGTYELFRHFFALPSHVTEAGEEVGATRGTVGSVLQLLEGGATHVGVATDHVIESFRNELWATYKDGSGVDPALKSQFPLLEEALEALGVAVFAMVEFEADDALAAAARLAAADERVDRVWICTPDKDMGQCVGGKVVQLDRRQNKLLDVDGVRQKFGVDPESIPDWLALVGDSADGFPGLAGWGAKSASAVLARWGHLENIPEDVREWDADVRGAQKLAYTLVKERELVYLFRVLATLRPEAPVGSSVDEWEWRGPTEAWPAMCRRLEAPALTERVASLTARRSS
jgi:5'-3' exonuclease